MAETTKHLYLDLQGLQQYDALIKSFISAEDAKSIKSATLINDVLRLYKVTAPTEADAYIEIDLSDYLHKIKNAKADNVVTLNADGTVKDSGVALTDLATKEEVTELNNIVGDWSEFDDNITVAEAISTMASWVGLDDEDVFSDNATFMEYVDKKVEAAKTEATYDDTQIKADIKAVDDKIGDLSELGEDATVESLFTEIAQVLGELDTRVGDVKTLGEDYTSVVEVIQDVVDVIGNYKDDFSDTTITDNLIVLGQKLGMTNEDFADSEESIYDLYVSLKNLIGDLSKLGEDNVTVESLFTEIAQILGDVNKLTTTDKTSLVAAINETKAAADAAQADIDAFMNAAEIGEAAIDTLKEIQEYITSDGAAADKMTKDIAANAKAIEDEVTRATGVESGLDERLTAVEGAVGEGGSVATQIENAINALDADVKSTEVEAGKGLQVQVVETDGKITTVAVTGDYSQTYDALGAASTAETNAKDYADNLDEAMDLRVDSLEEKVGEGFGTITEAEISALFPTL